MYTAKENVEIINYHLIPGGSGYPRFDYSNRWKTLPYVSFSDLNTAVVMFLENT
jgi:hypothetical protein